MYQFLALLNGAILAILISVNGNLSAQYGAFLASAIIHFVGCIAGGFLCCFEKGRQGLWRQCPLWIYLGGAIGVIMNIANNLAFGKISVTAIIALELLGQTVTALAIDSFGLFSFPRQEFKKKSLIVFAFSLIGIIVMLDRTVMSAVIAAGLSIIAGSTIVLQRIVNARLADRIGALRSSFVNHLTGFPITVIIAVIMFGEIPPFSAPDPRLWIYTGGIMGVIVVVLCNITVPRLPTFTQTILSFLGQVFTGICIDLLIGVDWSRESFYGGLIIIAGMFINYLFENRKGGCSPCTS